MGSAPQQPLAQREVGSNRQLEIYWNLGILVALSKSFRLARPHATVLFNSSPVRCDYNMVEISEECPSTYNFDWQLYHEQLFLARSMVFSGDLQKSQQNVMNLLEAVTRHFWFAFECPLAVASTPLERF